MEDCRPWAFQLQAVSVSGDRPTRQWEAYFAIERINEARIHDIGTLVARLHDLLEEYRNPNYVCPKGSHSFECGSILYGALSKQMKSAGLLEPYPVAPFSGMSFEEIYSKVRQFKSPKWCYPGKKKFTAHSCDLGEKVTEIAEMVIHSAYGFHLKDFGRTEFGGDLVAE
jgi:hypothetical protein